MNKLINKMGPLWVIIVVLFILTFLFGQLSEFFPNAMKIAVAFGAATTTLFVIRMIPVVWAGAKWIWNKLF